MTQSRTIVAAAVDTTRVTLYYADGHSMDVMQGDPRIAIINARVIPTVNRGEQIEIDLDGNPAYNEFAEKTNGLVRFFKAAKSLVNNLFTAEPTIAPGVYGNVPELVLTNEARQLNAVEQIMTRAEPITKQSSASVRQEETVVAVVNGKAIPGIEKLKSHIENSLKINDTVGLTRFLERISAVITERQHSVEDVITFLERADLPIAEDGSIIAYKILRKKGENHYVDCHTQNVPQKIGSFVHMDPKMVDPNRSKDCSQGLHVARRGYLGNFPGDVCVLIKMAPEDVIAVPQYDANKVRVCGYHILFELPMSAFDTLKRNRAMTGNPEAARLVGAAITGKHVGVLEYVKITGAKGQGVVITPGDGQPAPTLDNVPEAQAIPDEAIPGVVNPKQVSASIGNVVKQIKTKAASTPKAAPQSSRQIQARALHDDMESCTNLRDRQAAADVLLQFKRKSKVSWESLGLPEETGRDLAKIMSEEAPAPVKAAPISDKVLNQVNKQAATKVKEEAKAVAQANAPLSRRERAQQLLRTYLDTDDRYHRHAAATQLYTLKKTSKVSWDSLGVDIFQAENVMTLAQRPAPPAPIAPIEELITKPKASPQPKAKKTASVITEEIANQGLKDGTMIIAGETRAQIARRLYVNEDWKALLAHKKASKIGWDRLGFKSQDVARILLHTKD